MITSEGKLLVTTEPAPIVTLFPIDTPGKMVNPLNPNEWHHILPLQASFARYHQLPYLIYSI